MMATKKMKNAWLAFVKPKPQAALRLFCFPYSGGGASMFRTWSEGLPVTIEACPVQLPGRETRLRESPFTQMSSLVEAAAQALLPYLDKPFVFFGHSVGALICFDLARYLRQRHGLLPVHLFVSGRGAPQIPDPDPPAHALAEPEFIEHIRRYDGTSEEVLKNPELLKVFLPILRADFAINETYVYVNEAPLACPISAFGGLQECKEHYRTHLKDWRMQTTSRFSVQMFQGGHFFIHSARSLLLEAISKALGPLVERIV